MQAWLDAIGPEWGAVIISVIALVFSLFNFFGSRRRTRRKLVHAIYHHATKAVESLEGLEENNSALQKRMERDASFTPYIPCMDADDLTYDQIVEVMEMLEEEEQEAVLSYFHEEAALHTYAKSFDLDFVRSWPSVRRRRLWQRYVESQKKTLGRAKATVRILRKRVGRT